jgi:hypothetical protein
MKPSDDSLPVSVPDKFLWVAQDSNGVWWGYTAEPHRNAFGWYENEVGDSARLGETEPDNWEQSLKRVR